MWRQLHPCHARRTRNASSRQPWNEHSPDPGSSCQPLTYTALVLAFRETSLFTRRLLDRLTDAEYLQLQTALILQPELGDIIPNTGGIRKLRWSEARRGKGKRGGVRVIYYWYTAGSLIYFLHIYSKTEQADLSDDEKKALRKVMAQELK